MNLQLTLAVNPVSPTVNDDIEIAALLVDLDSIGANGQPDPVPGETVSFALDGASLPGLPDGITNANGIVDFTFSLPSSGVPAGPHTIEAVLASDTTIQASVNFVVQAVTPPPPPPQPAEPAPVDTSGSFEQTSSSSLGPNESPTFSDPNAFDAGLPVNSFTGDATSNSYTGSSNDDAYNPPGDANLFGSGQPTNPYTADSCVNPYTSSASNDPYTPATDGTDQGLTPPYDPSTDASLDGGMSRADLNYSPADGGRSAAWSTDVPGLGDPSLDGAMSRVDGSDTTLQSSIDLAVDRGTTPIESLTAPDSVKDPNLYPSDEMAIAVQSAKMPTLDLTDEQLSNLDENNKLFDSIEHDLSRRADMGEFRQDMVTAGADDPTPEWSRQTEWVFPRGQYSPFPMMESYDSGNTAVNVLLNKGIFPWLNAINDVGNVVVEGVAGLANAIGEADQFLKSNGIYLEAIPADAALMGAVEEIPVALRALSESVAIPRGISATPEVAAMIEQEVASMGPAAADELGQLRLATNPKGLLEFGHSGAGAQIGETGEFFHQVGTVDLPEEALKRAATIARGGFPTSVEQLAPSQYYNVLSLDVSAASAQRVIATGRVLSQLESTGLYGVLNNSCTTTSVELIRAAGLSPPFWARTPTTLQWWLAIQGAR